MLLLHHYITLKLLSTKAENIQRNITTNTRIRKMVNKNTTINTTRIQINKIHKQQ